MSHFALALPVPGRRLRALVGRVRAAGSRLFSALSALRGDPRERAIRAAATRLERGGALVFADIDGFPRPPAIRGFIPSVFAVYEDREMVLCLSDGEAESERLSRPHLTFLAWAEAMPSREYELIVIAPRRR